VILNVNTRTKILTGLYIWKHGCWVQTLSARCTTR